MYHVQLLLSGKTALRGGNRTPGPSCPYLKARFDGPECFTVGASIISNIMVPYSKHSCSIYFKYTTLRHVYSLGFVTYRHSITYLERNSTSYQAGRDGYACMYIHICMYACMYVCMYIHMQALSSESEGSLIISLQSCPWQPWFNVPQFLVLLLRASQED